jgi:hypothetical protein
VCGDLIEPSPEPVKRVTLSRETADLSRFRSTPVAEGKPWVDEHNYGGQGLTISH